MEEICRLCCSTQFVNNDIFDEENALYLKMSLYLPIKIYRDDKLPQKICDRCSCKVNDFYQFCNETIEVQDRLKAILLTSDVTKSIDLTVVKRDIDSPPPLVIDNSNQSIQTEKAVGTPAISNPITNEHDNINIKEEPTQLDSFEVKDENGTEDYSFEPDTSSDDSDMSLLTLKRKKSKNVIEETNSDIIDTKKSKRKSKLNELEQLMNNLPSQNGIRLEDNNCLQGWVANVVRHKFTQLEVKDEEVQKKIKKEPNEDEVYNCCICFAQYSTRGDILSHYRQHGSERSKQKSPPPSPPPPPDKMPSHCQRCRKVVDASAWAAHWKAHWERDAKPYRCSLCEKSFRDHHQILKHGLSHKFGTDGEDDKKQLEKRFVCDLCPQRFVYMRYLLAHRTRMHPDASSRALSLRCTVCARQFAHLNSLRRHQRAHSGERNFLCNICGKMMTSNEHLKFHIRIHTGYKPNVCKTCGKGFVKKCNLTLHERVHSGEKPHVCSHCGKAFSQRSTLVIHERYHSGSRPYVCTLCGSGFVAKGLLSMHLKTTCI